MSVSSTTPSVTDARRPEKQLVADVGLDSGSSDVHTAEVCPISKVGGAGLAVLELGLNCRSNAMAFASVSAVIQ